MLISNKMAAFSHVQPPLPSGLQLDNFIFYILHSCMNRYYVYFPRFLPRVCQAVDLDGNLTTDALLLDLPC